MGMVEEHDLDPNAIASSRRQKMKYRGTKDDVGNPIFNEPTADAPPNLLSLPLVYLPKNTISSVAEIVGDWNNAYYGILRNIEFKVLDQATLTTIEDDDGNPVNLAERDMFALRAIMEVGAMVVKDEAFAVINKTPTP